MTIQEKYDEFFGTGYWEKQYKDQICIFAKQVLEQRQETASAVDTIVMQKPFIRRYFELLKLTEEDCSCGRIARCDSCCAASVLNEVEELVKTEHGRLFA